MDILWLLLGALAALPLIWWARGKRIETQAKLFGQGLVIAAIIYIGFAIAWGSAIWILIEGLGVLLYGVFFLLGSKKGVVWIGVGWLLHPLWDAALHLYGPGSEVAPRWYAVACLSFDVVVAGYLFWLATTGRKRATRQTA